MEGKYIVADYSTSVDLASGLNQMSNEGYRPLFMDRTSGGFITVVYEKE